MLSNRFKSSLFVKLVVVLSKEKGNSGMYFYCVKNLSQENNFRSERTFMLYECLAN